MMRRLATFCRVALLSWMTGLTVSAAFVLLSCKGANSTPAKFDVDADPVALLPVGPIVVGSLDARAASASLGLGPTLGQVAITVSPLGADAGFDPSRDVDRIVVGVYGGTPADWVAVLGGRFDVEKLTAATRTKNGSPVVAGTYGRFSTHTAGAQMYVPVTSRTLVAGSPDGVRRVLDRLAEGEPNRRVPPWMSEAVATAGAQLVVVGDFQTEPVAAAALASLNVPWMEHLQVARVVANFQTPGLNVAATLTYSSDAEAQAARDGIRSLGTWVRTLGPLLGGIQLQGLEVKEAARDVQCSFALDDRSLGKLAAMATRFIPAAAQ